MDGTRKADDLYSITAPSGVDRGQDASGEG